MIIISSLVVIVFYCCLLLFVVVCFLLHMSVRACVRACVCAADEEHPPIPVGDFTEKTAILRADDAAGLEDEYAVSLIDAHHMHAVLHMHACMHNFGTEALLKLCVNVGANRMWSWSGM